MAHSRRQFIAGSSAIAFAPRYSFAAAGTQRFISQACHLIADVPAHWALGPDPDIGLSMSAIHGDDGFFDARPAAGDSLDAVASQFVNGFESEPLITENDTWQNVDVIRASNAEISVMFLPNPNPVPTFDGPADYLVMLGDPMHFQSILDTVTLSLESLTPPEIALSIVHVVKAHSYFRDDVDWNRIEEDAHDIESVGEIVSRYLPYSVIGRLRSAGDNHSFIYPVTERLQALQGFEPLYPTGQRIGDFAYLDFPATNYLTSSYADDYAQRGSDIRNQLAEEGVSGWIIDLRNMRGGSVIPPLTVLYPFLPDGKLAGFLNAYGDEMWIEKLGQEITPVSYQRQIDSIWPVGLDDPKLPIAVLMGSYTGSAGEFTLLATLARTGLATFGIDSAGYTTGNASFLLFDGSAFALASSAELDADGNVYTGKIEPMMRQTTVGITHGPDEETLAPVLDWLQANSTSA